VVLKPPGLRGTKKITEVKRGTKPKIHPLGKEEEKTAKVDKKPGGRGERAENSTQKKKR